MALKYKDIKEQMIAKNYAEDGLVALCQTVNTSTAAFWGGMIGAAIAGANNKCYAVSKIGEQLVFVPYTNKEINFQSAFAYNKSKITKAKVSGVGGFAKIKIWTVDGKTQKYSIIQGKAELQTILTKLEVPAK